MNKLGHVISFTYRNKVKNKSFRWTTLSLAVLLLIGLNIPYFIQLFSGNNGEDNLKIAIASSNYNEIATQIQQAAQKQQQAKSSTDNPMMNASSDLQDTKLQWQDQFESEATLRKQVEDGKIGGYLLLQKPSQGDPAFPAVTYVSEKNDVVIQSLLQTATQTAKVQYIAAGKLTNTQLEQIGTPVTVNHTSPDDLNGNADSKKENPIKSNTENYILVYLLMVLFFFSLTITGNMIASEITAEKSSRVMEILISSLSPLTQMFGKIIGVFLVGLTQIASYGIVIAVNLSLPYYQEVLAKFDLHVSNLSLNIVGFGLLYYVLGYFLYATLFAAIGSIVSRTEDLGQAISPITMLTLAAFYIGIFSISNSDSLLMRISSYIPFFSPTTSIVRIGLGSMPIWEIAISIGILLVSILFFGWLSAKIYRTGVLMYGKRPSLKELRKAMKSYKI
ncbi:ABC transporter permease [Paenibacillus sp. PsM32]|uniref:ABC transporter permease n=1 Tax=unclassified Paenibacillus TaxID=185978 RepID=UPI00263B59C5|nr:MULTISPECIES: ABC transporter permease [unclassified Paenibacillus]MDN4619400.1 ABC transporter permease [Paenibacillus sp. PsM32]MDQ1237061.1 ABC-2 type transport system permease protein [Paenibacillus sp. SORGH_AS_0306]MDR6109421.1 ABC-2 type transport system permease protein [Paenibacillus sp. SORGH_AS_0338]